MLHLNTVFKNLNIQFGKQLTVLVGINGAGKTSILEALAIMLSRLFSRIRSTKGTGQFTESDIRKGASKTANSIEIEFIHMLTDLFANKHLFLAE